MAKRQPTQIFITSSFAALAFIEPDPGEIINGTNLNDTTVDNFDSFTFV